MTPLRRERMRTGAVLAATAALLLLLLAACSPNDTFDPDSVANIRPVAGMSVAPPDTGTFPVTSYYERTFHWHGSDPDGWVVNFDMSMRTDPDVPAPWVTTTNTDTTVTFVTDDNGEAEAMFFIVARDNRGALSDTVTNYFPLRNSPPEINWELDFEPLSNLQREVTAPGDTTYWNWGHANFKLTVSDADGQDTMDDFFRYTFADTEPTETYPLDDPAADPSTTWVRVDFREGGDDPTTYGREFEITVFDLAPGERTLTVSVSDEGDSDARFTYTWEVRAPRSNILYIKDNTSSIGRACYESWLDDRFGAGGWDTYDFWMGYPDRHKILTSVMQEYDAVLWTDGGSTSDVMVRASENGGALQAYLSGDDPGHLLLVSSAVAGSSSRLGPLFRRDQLGVNSATLPVSGLTFPAGSTALPEYGTAPSMASAASSARGVGIQPYGGYAEVVYRMEECIRCYGTSRPPFDPVIGLRAPLRSVSAVARAVTVSAQLEYFDRDQVHAALTHLFEVELGVPAP